MFHFRSAARRLCLDARTWSVSHGVGGRLRADQTVWGQSSSKEVEIEENKRSVALSGDKSEKASGFGSASMTVVPKSVWESEQRLGLVVIICAWGRLGKGSCERNDAVNDRK